MILTVKGEASRKDSVSLGIHPTAAPSQQGDRREVQISGLAYTLGVGQATADSRVTGT